MFRFVRNAKVSQLLLNPKVELIIVKSRLLKNGGE